MINDIKNEKKKDIFIILAYTLFIYVAIIANYTLFLTLSKAFTVETSGFKMLFPEDYKIIDVIIAAFYIPAIIVFFNVSVRNKPLKLAGKIFIYIFIVINAVKIADELPLIYGKPLFCIVYMLFFATINNNIMIILLSIAFLKYGGDNNPVIKFLTNKWVLFSILIILLIGSIYRTLTAIEGYMDFKWHQSFFESISNGESSISNFIKFPYVQLIFTITLAISMGLLFECLINEKPVSKLSSTIIIASISLIAILTIVNIAQAQATIMEKGHYAWGGEGVHKLELSK